VRGVEAYGRWAGDVKGGAYDYGCGCSGEEGAAGEEGGHCCGFGCRCGCSWRALIEVLGVVVDNRMSVGPARSSDLCMSV